MVILLQLCIFAVFAIARGRYLFGRHLLRIRAGSGILAYAVRARNGRRTVLHIGLPLPGVIPFVIRRERWYHQSLKSMGIATEINVGNAAFDQTYFITTDFPGHLEQLLASDGLRAKVQQLFGMGVTSLHAAPDRIWCVIDSDHARLPDRDFARHPRLLRSIASASRSALARGREPPAARTRRVAALAVIAVQTGLLTFGILGFLPTFADSIHTVDMRALMLTGVLSGCVAAGLWLLAIVAFFRGSSWSSWVLTDFVLCGVLGLALAGISVVRDVNINMPQPAARVSRQSVVQKICVLECQEGSRKSKKTRSYAFQDEQTCAPASREAIMTSKRQVDPVCASSAWFTYTLRVTHWQGDGVYSFTTRAPVFDALTVGGLVDIPVHPGALGLEWVDWTEIGKN